METSELTLLDLLSFVKKLKVYVRSEVEKYVDEKAKEIKDKDKAATYMTNKVLNNMVGNKPLDASKVDEFKAGKPKRVLRINILKCKIERSSKLYL